MLGVTLYVGGQAMTCQRRRIGLTGKRMFTAAHSPRSFYRAEEVPAVVGILDSGAFSDSPARRLSPEAALARQLDWEVRASRLWGAHWQAEALVSYDLLIDEVWTNGGRHKRRWNVADAEAAVEQTVEAAFFLAFHRAALFPRHLILACQGVTAEQYLRCAQMILAFADRRDILGLGGWCILGRFTTWMPEFRRTVDCLLPEVQRAGIGHVHIFGVLYLPALSYLYREASKYGLEVSTDSAAPITLFKWRNLKKAGARADTWEANVAWWKRRLENIDGPEEDNENLRSFYFDEHGDG